MSQNSKSGEDRFNNPFDYENADHVENVANIAAKHKDFSRIPDVAKHLASTLSTGNWRHIEDPRIQDAIKQAGHDGYHVAEKHGKQQHVAKKASGGSFFPSIAEMRNSLAKGGQPDAPSDEPDLFQKIYGRAGTDEEQAAMAGKSRDEETAILQQSIDNWNQSHPTSNQDTKSSSLDDGGPSISPTLTPPEQQTIKQPLSNGVIADPNRSAPKITDEQRKFIDWQAKQTDPMQQSVIADQWARAGIIDPYSDPRLIANAQDAIDNANRRIQNTGGTDTAQWNDPNYEKYLGTNKQAYDIASKMYADPVYAAKFAKQNHWDNATANAWALKAYDPYAAAVKSASTPSKFTAGPGPQSPVDVSQIRHPGEAITAGQKYSQQYNPDQLGGIRDLWNQYSKDPSTMSLALNQFGFTPDDLGMAVGISKNQVQKYFTGQAVPTTGNQATTKDLSGINTQYLNAQNATDMLDTQGRRQLFSDWAKQNNVYGMASPGMTADDGSFTPWATINPITVQQSKALDASYKKMQDDYNKAHPFTPFELKKPVKKAQGGTVNFSQGGNAHPSLASMRLALAQKSSSVDLKNVGVNEAPNMSPKHFFPPESSDIGMPSPGGVATTRGMPIGGIDMSKMQAGQQLMPTPPQPPQGGQPPGAPGAPPPGGPGAPPGAPMGAPQGPTPPPGNMLSMTPQGQTMAALGGQKMAKGGQPSVDEMKAEMAAKKDTSQDKRVTIKAEGSGGVKGIVVPRHTLEGNAKVGAVGLHEMNEARAKVYGDEHREPLTLNKMANLHKQTLAEHFSKPVEEQHEAEAAALKRLREAKHLGSNANTLDESEKLDTVRHEHDEEGRTHIGFASKGVAGHALYTSGKGKDTKYHVINTCPGQTEGCGGGKDSNGIVDTKKGTCFAPNAESQYAGAAVRRAAHEQAKHDPAMTHDWILAHTGSLRNAARLADKGNQRLLFRPNVVDETDVSSRHAIRHLNEQRKAEDKPPIIANSYGKTNELHDPENGYYVTHSNVGPKVKKGQEIAENVGRDKARVRNTITAADNKGDFTNEQGNKTPPKGSYMVTDVKRGSPMAKKMEEHITHAKYWSTGRPESELTHEERAEGPEGHFSGSGRRTSEEHAHYGHRTHEGLRYDYQRQHILHPRLVQVGNNKDGTKHMIPTDSRFKDTEFLPKNRFKTKNGKEAGHILMTTPTESTSNIGHQTSFTHNVNDKHIEHAQKNNGEYEIDRPEDQAKAKGKEYVAPQAIKFYAEGGTVGGRHPGFADDDFHAFPEQNVVAQRHLAMRHGEDEHKQGAQKKAVVVHKNTGTMRYEMSMNKKAK